VSEFLESKINFPCKSSLDEELDSWLDPPLDEDFDPSLDWGLDSLLDCKELALDCGLEVSLVCGFEFSLKEDFAPMPHALKRTREAKETKSHFLIMQSNYKRATRN